MASSGSKDDGGRWSLKGMTALVTGGTRGIGYAVVEELAGFGATVHTCSRNEAELNKCLEEWNSKGFQVTGSVCDVSSRAEREKLIETVSSTFNAKLNILVNNVGRNIRKPPMTTNFDSVYHLCQLAYPLLKASGMGSTLYMFISSVAGVVAINSGTIYAASKVADDKGFVDKIIAQTPLRRVGDPKEVSSLVTRFLLHYWAGYYC